MNYFSRLKIIIFLIVLLLGVIAGESEGTINSEGLGNLLFPKQSGNVTVIVFGRSGVGISSTITSIIGSKFSITSQETEELITTYEVKIPCENENLTSESFLRLIDVAGVVDDKTMEQDAKVLASLKAYFLQNRVDPSIFLFISRFDDSRFDGEESNLVRMVQRGILVYKEIFGKFQGSKTLFLFTRLMAETKREQRIPRTKLERFKIILNQYTNGAISTNVSAVVGENRGEDYDLNVEGNGWVKLPNREYYPLNVLKAFKNVTDVNGDVGGSLVFEKFINNWNSTKTVTKRPFVFTPDAKEVGKFIQKVLRIGKASESNELNDMLQFTYDQMDPPTKIRLAPTLLKLQEHFLTKNFTKLSEIPTKPIEQVKLLHNLPVIVDSDISHLLDKALGIKIRPFIKPPTVGYGYDVMKDALVEITPFANSTTMSAWIPTPMMYKLPSFLTCTKLSVGMEKIIAHFSNTTEDALKERMNYLHFEKSALNLSLFEGQLKLGFNVQPDPDDMASLTAVKEVRDYKIELNDNLELNEDFMEALSNLEPFDSAVRDSEKSWRQFFDIWGTHVISSAFAGGFIQGTVMGDEVTRIVDEREAIPQVFEGLMNFTLTNASEGGFTFYGVVGGDKNPKLATIHQEPNGTQIVEQWIQSVRFDPVVLSNELRLMPMNDVVRRVNLTLSHEVERALGLLMRGELQYKRVRNRDRVSTSTTTIRPMISTRRPQQQRPTVTPTTTRRYSYGFETSTTASTFSKPSVSDANNNRSEHLDSITERNGFPRQDDISPGSNSAGNDTNQIDDRLKKAFEDWSRRDKARLEQFDSFVQVNKEQTEIRRQEQAKERRQFEERVEKERLRKLELKQKLDEEETRRRTEFAERLAATGAKAEAEAQERRERNRESHDKLMAEMNRTDELIRQMEMENERLRKEAEKRNKKTTWYDPRTW